MTIYGNEGTNIQSYAETNSIPFSNITEYEGYADANGDGAVNALDATIVARYAVGTATLDTAQTVCCDVNADGRINAMDATLIARYAVGEIESFE